MNLRMVDKLGAWVLLLLGIGHCVMAMLGGGQMDAEWTLERIWFLSGGLGMVFLAVLNLFRVGYWEQVAPLAPVTLTCNLAQMAFTVWLGLHVSLRANPQIILGMVVVAMMIRFSLQQVLAQKPAAH